MQAFTGQSSLSVNTVTLTLISVKKHPTTLFLITSLSHSTLTLNLQLHVLQQSVRLSIALTTRTTIRLSVFNVSVTLPIHQWDPDTCPG